jgi:hypothetical protein
MFAALRLLAEYESAGQIVLVQHKENERIGEARITIRSALPIVIEIA